MSTKMQNSQKEPKGIRRKMRYRGRVISLQPLHLSSGAAELVVIDV
jgi:hypothetical protein